MAGFLFQYETLLKHRSNVEDQCQRELAAELRKQMILMNRLKSMQQTITDSKHALGQGLVGKVDLHAVTHFTSFTHQVTGAGHDIVLKLAEMEGVIAAARQRLLEATRDRKALEHLREKAHAAWRREEARREAAELDELSTQAYARRRILGGA